MPWLRRVFASSAPGLSRAIASLERIFSGAEGVFGVTQPWDPGIAAPTLASEIAQGRAIIDAAKRAGVRQLMLYTAMRVDDKPTGLPHVDSKLEISATSRGSGVPFTLLRPGTFMDNIGQSFFPIKKGVVRGFRRGRRAAAVRPRAATSRSPRVSSSKRRSSGSGAP